MYVTDLTVAEQRELPYGWLNILGGLVATIAKREGATLPTQEEFNKAARMSPRDNLRRWAGAASLYIVKDDDREFMVAVLDGGSPGKAALNARCSCDSPTVCAHLLTVLGSRTGPLA